MNNRHRSIANKVYLPSNARYNQYLLAEFKITDQLIATVEQSSGHSKQRVDKLKPFQSFYQKLGELFFSACEDAHIENAHFIANDKLPRVRFSEEIRCWETQQQLLVFYNPANHQAFKSHYDASIRAQKVSLLFLASGEDIRSNAAAYHQKVSHLLQSLLPLIGVPNNAVRLRDHQHLTYHLFARNKGIEGTHSHTLRLIKTRYQATDVALPEDHDAMSYVVASMPITRKLLKLVEIDLDSDQPYEGLYQRLGEACTNAASQHKLLNGAFIADGSSPIIRNSDKKAEQKVGEMVMLGFDPQTPKNEFICRWQGDKLVDYAQIIFAATASNVESKGYGKFMETVDKALRSMAKALELTPERDEITVRFHQHVAYNVVN